MSTQKTFDTAELSGVAPDHSTQPQQSSNKSSLHQHQKQPDASTSTPSEMREHLGAPDIAHDYPEDSTHQRHSSVSAQQAHFMK